MVNHDDAGKLLQERCQIGKVGGLEIDNDMPAKTLHPLGGAHEHLTRRCIDQTLDEIEPDTAHPGRMHPVEFFIGDVMRHHRNAPRQPARRPQRVDHRAVILAMAACLHNDIARQAKMIAQREQHVLAGIAGGVFAFRRERKRIGRPEHMAMRVDRAPGRREIGPLGIGVPGNLAT